MPSDDARLDGWEDNFFGVLRWDTTFEEWHVQISFPLHGEVDIGLPLEYRGDIEIQAHIQTTFQIVKRDEFAFRQRAAQELFDKGGYVLFWPKDKPKQVDEFAHQMHLGLITFEPEFPDTCLTLGYEYGDGVEHGIDIYLTWEGVYRYARES